MTYLAADNGTKSPEAAKRGTQYCYMYLGSWADLCSYICLYRYACGDVECRSIKDVYDTPGILQVRSMCTAESKKVHNQ